MILYFSQYFYFNCIFHRIVIRYLQNIFLFLKNIIPITNNIKTAIREIPKSSQFIGSVPKRTARDAFITPVIGLSAKRNDHFPAILAGYITGVTKATFV